MQISKNKFFKDLFQGLDGYIEIRETSIQGKIINRNFFNNVQELLEYIPEKNLNTYFSLAVRGNKRDTKGRIDGTNANSTFIKCLWLDFDNVKSWEQIEYALCEANIDSPNYVVKSGSKNSYHLYWVLTKPIKANEAAQIVKQMAAETGADTKPTSAAQMMRMPDSYNQKNNKKVITSIHTKQHFEPSYFHIRFGVKIYQTLDSVEKKLDKKIISNIKKTSHMACINKMLNGVRKGQRNFTLRWLITYFRDIECIEKIQAYRLIVNWNTKCRPMMNNQELIYQFNYIWDKSYQKINCKIEEIKYFCKKNECIYHKDSLSNFMQGEKSKFIKYDMKLIPKLKDLSGNELIILGIFSLFRKLTYKDLKEKVSTPNYTYLTDKTKRKILSELVFKKILIKDKLDYILQEDKYSKNYISMNTKTLKDALKKKISGTEYKNMLILKSYASDKQNKGGSKIIAFPTQMTLGLVQDKARNTISEHLSQATEKGYITKQVYTINKQNYLKYYLHY